MNIRYLTAALLLLWASSPLYAQKTTSRPSTIGSAPAAKAPHLLAPPNAEPPVRHVSQIINSQPNVQRTLEALRSSSPPAAAKTASAYTVGETRTFDVFNIDTEEWMEDIPFVLKAQSSALYLWVEEAELDSNYVRTQDVDSLYSALQEKTPAPSFDSDEGIIVNNNEVFGQPSDIDSNGRVHVLLTDIKDGRKPELDEPYVAGFFHGTDLNRDPSSEGNSAEVLYLDTRPGIYTDNDEYRLAMGLQSTAAHEYQHLIHAKYDPNEFTFVNEGLSEWAETLNGFPRRSARYLLDSSDSTGYNVSFFLWRSGEDNVLNDYQRAGLFTQYLSEQTDVMSTGSVTRTSQKKGIAAYNTIIPERSFQEFLLDFHTANIFNNTDYNPQYGYTTEKRQNTKAKPSLSYDGRVHHPVSDKKISISSGAVQYLTWEHVEDLSVTFEEQAPINTPNRLRVRTIAQRPDGSITESTFTPDRAHQQTFEGAFEKVTYVVAHVYADESKTSAVFSAAWNRSDTSYARQTVAYDKGVPMPEDSTDATSNPVLFSFENAPNKVRATRFAVPSDSGDAVLSRVSLAFYYLNQFEGGPPEDAPRDFTLHLWNNNKNNRPGQEIFSDTFDDPRSFVMGAYRDTLVHFSVDLSKYQDQLSNLPDTVHIGVSEAGADTNYTVVVPAPYQQENTSFVGDFTSTGTQWDQLWDLSLSNGISLKHSTLPIRAEFLVPGADTTVQEPTAADSLMLSANYPNPFNNRTRINFSLPEEGPVQLAVYNVLGQRMAVPVDEQLGSGSYTVEIDASGWASGIYFYMLEFKQQRLSKKMMLIK